MFAMAAGPVFGIGYRLARAAAPQMRSHTPALVEDLHGCRHGANLNQFLHQVVRHAVIVAVENHVIVDIDSGLGPLAQVETLAG
jgi:hypothetical protein